MSLLEGVRILDFSTLLPGPYATMMLADLGADVLRIESHVRKDDTRSFPPFVNGVSAAHGQLNRSKKSMSLDLKKPEAVDIVKGLVQDYDIVLEQFRPGVMDRLGVGYDALKAVNPRIIFCSLTGYGQTGPYRDRAGHDNNYLSISGIMGYSGRKETGPTPIGTQVADIAGGSLHSIIGILSAIIHRQKTGEGQWLDISMTDSCFTMNAMLGAGFVATGMNQPERESMILNGGSFYDFYETSDGRYFSVGSLEPKFFASLCEAIGRPDLVQTAMKQSEEGIRSLKTALKHIFREKTFAEWKEIFSQREACVEPVLDFAEACGHPQISAREMIVEVPDGKGSLQKQIANPIKSTAFNPVYYHTGSKLGEHTEKVLREMGKSDKEISLLRENGTIA
ncbi:CaiB/BaiF CoA-transferase family protein [Bacillus sp. V5-8f]|uniref:CaiB/BaiF CoA transferase family protein n=1 Tax=Bacillus sp. V5-8f TaxID=2053044 RepID=UPI000C7570AA|nr:CaiB/BaiF CoA-transferase family protein [Bacillus sp. V5-8f]PLT35514.1 carnitine dehydratase [Bacillus sp. V5-8f]